jgi:hypothetical protein
MTFVWRAALVMCIIFAGCLFGILLQHWLPTQHLATAKSESASGARTAVLNRCG